MTIEYVSADRSWDARERERQQVLRDRLRNTLRSGNPGALIMIEETVIDVSRER